MKLEFGGSWALRLWESEYQEVEVEAGIVKVTGADGRKRTIRIKALVDHQTLEQTDGASGLCPLPRVGKGLTHTTNVAPSSNLDSSKALLPHETSPTNI